MPLATMELIQNLEGELKSSTQALDYRLSMIEESTQASNFTQLATAREVKLVKGQLDRLSGKLARIERLLLANLITKDSVSEKDKLVLDEVSNRISQYTARLEQIDQRM